MKNIGPFDAIKESVALIKKAWGKEIVGQGCLGAVFMLVQTIISTTFLGLIILLWTQKSTLMFSILGGLWLIATIITTLTHLTLSGIYSAALYRYASNLNVPQAFDIQALRNTFLPKK